MGKRLLQLVDAGFAVEGTATKIGDSVAGMCFFHFDLFNKSMRDEDADSVTRVPPGKISVVGNVGRSEGETCIEHAQNGHVGALHPVHLPMHNTAVERKGLYVTRSNSGSHGIALSPHYDFAS